ncbi:selenium cofactor biosynthesis protein YqeC [Rubrobacter aplysinae]|uniref:selenium cofactor biosynthesis protein YqeC n=1 Tax=Rubrobacter aplysinae TaxID=909625 RepID=UPI00069E0063|nr:selenium cofactor biosynthesis protein YqeC [Rubrobacter aplysinae]
MRLYEALGIGPGETVAFAGAGGKSSAIAELCGELSGAGMKALAVPTTKMFVSEAESIGRLVTAEEPAELRRLVSEAVEALPGDGGSVVAGSGRLSKGRISGVEPGQVPGLAALADVTLVEADGARRRSLKGTAAHEPAIPEGVSLSVAVGGSRSLGLPLDEESVHRPELFSELTGILPGQSISPQSFAVALAKGSLKDTPDGVRRAALLTGVEPGPGMSGASAIARELWRLGIQRVVLTSLPAEGPAMIWNA